MNHQSNNLVQGRREFGKEDSVSYVTNQPISKKVIQSVLLKA